MYIMSQKIHVKSWRLSGRDDSAKTQKMAREIQTPALDDFHIHLRQGRLMQTVTEHLRDSGVKLAYVMPNLKPPVTTTQMALDYKAQLEAILPDMEFLMTLYLVPELTPDEVYKAAKAGISGVKSYPRGVTTNSDSGIESYTTYYPVFKAMEEVGMVLNLHGEVPSDPESDVCVMNAEIMFLKHLKQLHQDFPNLRIVLEHASTKAAVDMVKSLGDTVGCTITVHHLSLVVDDWAGCCHNFCKPVAKFPHDRKALQDVVRERTDSAPHSKDAKETSRAAAGVYTGAYIAPYLATVLESFGALDALQGFACEFGRKFYKLPFKAEPKLTLVREPMTVPPQLEFTDDNGQKKAIVPFMASQALPFSIKK